MVPNKNQETPHQKLTLKIEKADTEELKDIEIQVESDTAFYKVGDGETCHFHIP